MSEVCTVLNHKNFLGEGPVWSAAEQALYWVDIKQGQVYRYAPESGTTNAWDMGDMVAVITPSNTGKLVAVCQGAIKSLCPTTAALATLEPLERRHPNNRPNDGKVDPAGRLWFGTSDDLERERSGSLYYYERGKLNKVLSDIGNPNTFAWSPDGTRFYTADSVDQTMYVFDYDIETASISNRRVFFSLKGTDIIPDGSTVDAEGYLWNAQWNGWRVVRYSPGGEVDRIIDMPTACPTSCMFGGKNLKTLYVTSARKDQGEASLAKQPDAGALFSMELDVGGIAETAYQIA